MSDRWDEVIPEKQADDDLLTGVTARTHRVEARIDHEKVQQAAEIRLAKLACLKWLKHDCSLPVPCTHPNHRRDIHEMKFRIRHILGITPTASKVSDADFRALLAASGSLRPDLSLDDEDAA